MEYIIGVIVGTLIPTIINFFTNRTLKNLSNHMDEKKKDEQEFNLLMIESILSLGENDRAIFEALKAGKANGNLQKAIDKFNNIEDKLNDYIRHKATRD